MVPKLNANASAVSLQRWRGNTAISAAHTARANDTSVNPLDSHSKAMPLHVALQPSSQAPLLSLIAVSPSTVAAVGTRAPPCSPEVSVSQETTSAKFFLQ